MQKKLILLEINHHIFLRCVNLLHARLRHALRAVGIFELRQEVAVAHRHVGVSKARRIRRQPGRIGHVTGLRTLCLV